MYLPRATVFHNFVSPKTTACRLAYTGEASDTSMVLCKISMVVNTNKKSYIGQADAGRLLGETQRGFALLG